jgi:hypothetical protein
MHTYLNTPGVTNMNQLVKSAIARIENELQIREGDTVADILADIIHYCNKNDLIFAEILDQAEMYVTEDESFDEEMNEASN